MNFEPQPTIQNELVSIRPLKAEDFEMLYQVANDPLLWEQHPNPDRYKRDVFQNFFNGAMESGGAFFVTETTTGETIGSSRYYDFNGENSRVLIGYTFISRAFWGKSYNKALKTLMLDHAFKYVEHVHFHIGATNFRSQKAIEKIGARKIGEANVTYYGERSTKNFIYKIERRDWANRAH